MLAAKRYLELSVIDSSKSILRMSRKTSWRRFLRNDAKSPPPTPKESLPSSKSCRQDDKQEGSLRLSTGSRLSVIYFDGLAEGPRASKNSPRMGICFSQSARGGMM